MKFDLSSVQEGNEGTAKITCYEASDYRRLSLLIREGDIIFSKIRRNINGNKVKLFKANVKVNSIEYESGFEELTVCGVLSENCDAGLEGSSQRVLLFNGSEFSLTKSEWKKEDIALIEESSVKENSIDTVVIVFQYKKCIFVTRKYAHLKTISECSDKKTYFKSISNFLESIKDSLKCAVVLSTNNIGKEFTDFVRHNAPQLKLVDLVKSNAFIEEKIGNSTKEDVMHVLNKASMKEKISSLVEASLIYAYHNLMETMNNNSQMVGFGVSEFKKAAAYGAIDTVLVADSFIDSLNNVRKEKFMNVLKYLKSIGSKVISFPKTSNYYSNIESMSGIAFTLRYAIQ